MRNSGGGSRLTGLRDLVNVWEETGLGSDRVAGRVSMHGSRGL